MYFIAHVANIPVKTRRLGGIIWKNAFSMIIIDNIGGILSKNSVCYIMFIFLWKTINYVDTIIK